MIVRQEPEGRQWGINWRQADEVGVSSVSWRDKPGGRLKRGVIINLCHGEREDGLRITVSRCRARQIAIALAQATGMEIQRQSPFRRLPRRLSRLLNKHTAEIATPQELVEVVARIIDPDAWHEALPADGCGAYWIGRRNKARTNAQAILQALIPYLPVEGGAQ